MRAKLEELDMAIRATSPRAGRYSGGNEGRDLPPGQSKQKAKKPEDDASARGSAAYWGIALPPDEDGDEDDGTYDAVPPRVRS